MDKHERQIELLLENFSKVMRKYAKDNYYDAYDVLTQNIESINESLEG